MSDGSVSRISRTASPAAGGHLEQCATLVAGLFVFAASACSGPSSAPRARAPERANPAPPAASPRWLPIGGATAIGPNIGGGTLVLLGGRRALVGPHGAFEAEKVPAPEPLHELVVVPTPRGRRLVGRGAHSVYRFDEPLGPARLLVRSESKLHHLGSAPGLFAVWSGLQDPPKFFDVETGHAAASPAVPSGLLLALAFIDARRGAAVVGKLGIEVTTDGGASWQRAPGKEGGTFLDGLRQHGEGVSAFAWSHTMDFTWDATVDIDGAQVGGYEVQWETAEGPDVLSWIRDGADDPLELAAARGLDVSAFGGGAFVVSRDRCLVARVDLLTGNLVLYGRAGSSSLESSFVERAGDTAWVSCHAKEAPDQDIPDPHGVVGIPLAAFSVPRPVVWQNGPFPPATSPSGGVMVSGACAVGAEGMSCVRQPNGTWTTISQDPPSELNRAEGPLVDGRVAFLRGLFEGDRSTDKDAGFDGPRRLQVVALGPGGWERVIGSAAFPPGPGALRVQSSIEEDPDHTLRFVVANDEGAFAFAVKPGPEPGEVRRIPGATMARLRGLHGLAVGQGHLLTSDGGMNWREIEAPQGVLDAARRDFPAIELSEVGFTVGSWMRLGWDP